jgi:hypothetical protein
MQLEMHDPGKAVLRKREYKYTYHANVSSIAAL